jgi:hypothetical protein
VKLKGESLNVPKKKSKKNAKIKMVKSESLSGVFLKTSQRSLKNETRLTAQKPSKKNGGRVRRREAAKK